MTYPPTPGSQPATPDNSDDDDELVDGFHGHPVLYTLLGVLIIAIGCCCAGFFWSLGDDLGTILR